MLLIISAAYKVGQITLPLRLCYSRLPEIGGLETVPGPVSGVQ